MTHSSQSSNQLFQNTAPSLKSITFLHKFNFFQSPATFSLDFVSRNSHSREAFPLVLCFIGLCLKAENKNIGREERSEKLELQENMKKILKRTVKREIVGHDLFL